MLIEKEKILKAMASLKEKTNDVIVDVFGENEDLTPAKEALFLIGARFFIAMPGNPTIEYKGKFYQLPEKPVNWWKETLTKAVEENDAKFINDFTPFDYGEIDL